MRITSKGQVTIPQEVRDRLGLLPNTEVAIRVEGERAVLEKVNGERRRGDAIVAAIRGTGTVRLSTDEILALTRDLGNRRAPQIVRPAPAAKPPRRTKR